LFCPFGPLGPLGPCPCCGDGCDWPPVMKDGSRSTSVIARLEVLLPGLVVRLLLRLRVLLRLLLALIVGLLWRERLAAHGRLVIVAVVKGVVGVIAALLRLLLIERRLGLPQVFLRGGDQAEIMLGVLVVVFGRDRIA